MDALIKIDVWHLFDWDRDQSWEAYLKTVVQMTCSNVQLNAVPATLASRWMELVSAVT